MYGINWCSVFGVVMDDPIPVKDYRGHPGVAFRVDASYGGRDLKIWCYSFVYLDEINERFKLRKGLTVGFHGQLGPPSSQIRTATGQTVWSLGIIGRLYVAMQASELVGDNDHQHMAPCIMTGMVLPPVKRNVSKLGTVFLAFKLHSEQDMIWEKKGMHWQQDVNCYVQDIADTPKTVVPGAILLCRGKLDMATTGWVYCHFFQVQSLGEIQVKLVERYKNKPVVFSSGNNPLEKAGVKMVRVRQTNDI